MGNQSGNCISRQKQQPVKIRARRMIHPLKYLSQVDKDRVNEAQKQAISYYRQRNLQRRYRQLKHENYIKSKSQYYQEVIKKVFIHGCMNLIHRITQLDQLDEEVYATFHRNQVQTFMDDIQRCNIELIDMLAYSSQYKSINYGGNIKQIIDMNEVVKYSWKRSIGRSQNIIKKSNFNGSKNGNVNERKNHENINNFNFNNTGLKDSQKKKTLSYDDMKSIGLQIIKQQSVAFIILCGGKNTRFNGKHQHTNNAVIKQLLKLNLPSNKSLLQLHLDRLNELGSILDTKLSIFLIVNASKWSAFEQFIQNNRQRLQYLAITSIEQTELGAMNQKGEVIINDLGNIEFWPTGTGYLWDFIQQIDDNQLLSDFKYFEIMGAENILQHCFDCYMLGRIHNQGLDWAAKVTKNIHSRSNSHPQIYHTDSNNIYVCGYSEENNYPSFNKYTFTNHSIISTNFIKHCLSSKQLRDNRMIRMKTIHNYHKFPYSNSQFIHYFQKQYTDIFSMSNKFKYFCVNPIYQHYPIIYQEGGISDTKGAVIALSELHKSFLEFPIGRPEDICEICPSVSLQGEGLESVIAELNHNYFSFPLYICHHEHLTSIS